MRRVAFVIALAGLSVTASAAGVYRCTEGGKSIYSDKPCPSSATASVAIPVPSSRGDDPSASAINPQHESNMGRVVVGQTPVQVEMAWGKPRTKNIDTGSSGRTEQWVYERQDGTVYVYFRGGRVASYSQNQSVKPIAQESRPDPTPRFVSRAELEAQERADKAGERKFISVGTGSGRVLAKIGEPESKTFNGLTECWHYSPTKLDQQTVTSVCLDGGRVYDVQRTVKY